MPSTFGKLQSPDTAIPPGQHVAVTGANGCMGSHICDQLLSLGYRVRGVVRDAERSRWLDDYFSEKHGHGQFELVQVSDMAAEGACDDAVAGAHGVIHVAANTSLDINPDTVIPQMIATALGVAKSAANSPSCVRFVYTSSSSAVAEPDPGVVRTVTADTFNEQVVADAYSENLPGGIVGGHTVYAAGKTRAEQAIWKWYSETAPSFTLNVVIPSPCFGQVLYPEKQGYSAANRVLKMLWDGNSSDDVVGALQARELNPEKALE
ncbi:hypothetical protein AK830_g437 [Neonectria ditissima]|uniref:NAD-dependent epimerase/dehydratase domain-containing protein n=1 Tax=Neonectria ditissima TaxID=78410 RepID=A0A0P7BW36_9HYPO|nr:hypothetical protein AK830_g437 [Neonectria ditissima]